MKKLLLALATLLAMALPEAAPAQTITQVPTSLAAGTVADLGAGPMEVVVYNGQAWAWAAKVATSTSGAATSASTALTFQSTPTVAPGVGSPISGAGIAAGTTVIAYNSGTLTMTLSANATVPLNSLLTYTAGCPAQSSWTQASTPGVAAVDMRGDQADRGVPFFTLSHVCVATTFANALVLAFPIGAW